MKTLLRTSLALPFALPCLLALGCGTESDDADALPTDACVPDDGGACGPSGGAGGSGGEGGQSTGGTPSDAPVISVIWEGPGADMPNDDDSVTVAIDDGEGTHTYHFGLAETGSANGWYGEDCLPGDMTGKDVCHDVGAEGEVISSVSRAAGVNDGNTLLWRASADAERLTYVVIQVDTDRCWTFGDDPTYYSDSLLGCAPYDSPVGP